MDGGSESRLWHVLGNLFSKTTEEDVEKAIIDAREEGELEAEEGSMLLNVLSLDETQVHEIMVPRTDIVCAETTTSIGDLVSIIVESGHSRIPLYKENRDNIVGLVYAKDLLINLYDPTLRDTPLVSFMRKPFFVPETKIVTELLQEFRTRKQHLAIAVDEYGGTSGLITIEDILEEIVGDIEDEYDAPKIEDIRQTDDGGFIITGRASLDDVSEELDISLDSDQVETLGGYLSELAGHVPQTGEHFELEGYTFTIEDADAKQIRLIRSTKPSAMPDTE
ncbi:MAG: hemolysin family protein [Desulfovibrionales bacterium]|nr:hemolysin family protein [Desulfovibrionales bacterium]